MSKREKQTAFLKTLVLHGNATAREHLFQKISKAEREEHCSWCALCLVLVLTLLSVCGLCYSSVLLPDFFRNPSQAVTRGFCALGLASGVCSIVFMGCWLWYRGILNRLHEDSRKFILNILESQFHQRQEAPHGQDAKEQTVGESNATETSSRPLRRQQNYWELFRVRKAS